MRNARVRIFQREEIGAGGWSRPRYRAIRDAWARYEPPTGRDLERFETTEHGVSGVFTFDLATLIPRGGMLRIGSATDGSNDHRIVSVLVRQMLREQHVYTEQLVQGEQPHEVIDIGAVTWTPLPFTVLAGEEKDLSVRITNLSGTGYAVGVGDISLLSLNPSVLTVGDPTANADDTGVTWVWPLTGVAAGFAACRVLSTDNSGNAEMLRAIPCPVQAP